jgi:ribose transport system permease protein
MKFRLVPLASAGLVSCTKFTSQAETTAMQLTWSKEWKSLAALLASILVLAIIFAFLNPRFGSIENFRNILFQMAVPLIVIVGATFVIQMGSIDLSVEGIMVGAGMTWILMSANTRNEFDYGIWSWIVAIGIGLGLGLLAGALHSLVKVPSFVVTLGTWYIGFGISTILFGDDPLPTLLSDTLLAWPTQRSAGLPNAFWLAAVIFTIGLLISRYTHFGRSVLAIGNSEAIARNIGIPVNTIKIIAFAIAGVLSAIAGILATMQIGSGSSDLANGQLFTVIPAAVIGGTALSGGEGGMLRSAIGVLLLIMLSNGLVLAGVSPAWQSGIFGAILIAAIVVVARPEVGRLKIAK